MFIGINIEWVNYIVKIFPVKKDKKKHHVY